MLPKTTATTARVQDRLIRRPALPYELVDQLVGVIGERLEWELVRERRIDADEARQLMAATRDRATLNIVAREHGETHARARVAPPVDDRASSTRRSSLTFLRDGEISRVEAGPRAAGGHRSAPRVRQLLYGLDKRGLAALVRPRRLRHAALRSPCG